MLFQIKLAATLPLINELRGRAARVQPSVKTRLDRFPTLQHRRPSGIAADSCPAPLPAGVSVLLMSPGSKVMNWLTWLTRLGTSKIISLVELR